MKNKKIEPNKRKRALIALIACALFVTVYAIDAFFDNFTLQPPVIVKFQFPVARRVISPVPDKADTIIKPLPTKTVTPTPTNTPKQKTEKEIIDQFEHADVLWRVYQLETQRGKTDYCRNNNKGYGGFGVKSAGKIVCYDTFAKAVERAQYWLVKNGLEKNLVNALCTYNLGHNRNASGTIIPHMNCKYYQDYLTI